MAVAIGLGATVTAVLGDAQARLDTFDPTTPVAVATRPLEPGRTLLPDDVVWRDLPAGAHADATVTDGDPTIVGRTVHDRIEANEPIVTTRLAPPALAGVAARTPAGHRSVAVPIDDRAPPLVANQQVDLYAASSSGPGRLVAARALVVDVDDDGHRATVAVRLDEVPLVAAALVEATVVIAIVGAD